jgi:hypothetical protein
LKPEFCCSGRKAADKIALQSKRLRCMRAGFAISLNPLGTEWRSGNGKTKAAKQGFQPDIFQAQALTRHVRQLKRLAAALRRTRGKMAASSFANLNAMRQHLAFARRHDGKGQLSGVGGSHKIAEKIPQRSRAPVTFRWARVEIEQCACEGGRSRDSVNSNPPRRVVAFDRLKRGRAS